MRLITNKNQGMQLTITTIADLATEAKKVKEIPRQ